MIIFTPARGGRKNSLLECSHQAFRLFMCLFIYFYESSVNFIIKPLVERWSDQNFSIVKSRLFDKNYEEKRI